jgi:poly-beta-1,6-N-acetyl-D-glucosamine synthase
MSVASEGLLILFGFVVLIQLYFYFFRFGRVAWYRKPKVSARPQVPVTVIVCAHNESQNLRSLLPRLLEQDYPHFEVLVVDDRSTDYTHTWLEEESKKDPRVRSIHIEQTTNHFTPKKYALTMGIKHAAHDVILLTDADCQPNSPFWLSHMAAKFEAGDTKINLGYSQYHKRPGFLNAFIRFETLYSGLLYLGAALARMPYMGVGRNLAYRKSFFLERKGFMEHRGVISGDDDLFVNYNANKRNTTVTIAPEALVFSNPKTSWTAWFNQKLRHWSAGKLYRAGSRIGLGLFMLSQWLFWITFVLLLSLWIEPYLVLGVFLFRTLLLYYLMIQGSKKLGDPFRCWYLLLLDFLMIVYQLVVGIVALFTKQTKWK